MPAITLAIGEEAMKRLEQRSRYARSAPETLAGTLLTTALEVERFPNGAIQSACEKLRDVLLAIPTASDWQWSGVDHRRWWVSVRFDERWQHFGKVIRTLGAILNTDVLQSWGYKPFVFTPELGCGGALSWQIATLVSMVDAREVAEYLHERLPSNYQQAKTWETHEPHL